MPLRRGASWRRSADARSARLWRGAGVFAPFLVNSVVGFIGPEYLYDGKQIARAALEDHFCGKLLGCPMGVDICYTNHAEADGDDTDAILTLLGVAGVNFIMGVPGSDDIMLNYQSTSFHDALYSARSAGSAARAGIRGLAGADRTVRRWSDRRDLAPRARTRPHSGAARSAWLSPRYRCPAWSRCGSVCAR